IEHEHVNTGEAYSGNITLPADLAKHLEDEDGRVLKRLDAVASRFSPTASTRVLHGRETAQTLIEEATANQVDLVVMATHSRGGVGEAILGSVAHDVTKAGGIPVLLVHPEHAARPNKLPLGAYVFTSDGQELGRLEKVSGHQITVKHASGHEIRLSAADVAAIEGGRIVLHYDASDLPRHLSAAVRA
ncbi:MAG: universal stress protein, partial [Tepidiformaceae bacterium]